MASVTLRRAETGGLQAEDIRPIRYGSRLRLGMLLPSSNLAAEPDLRALLPEGCSVHTTRLKLAGASREDMLGMTEKVEEAALLLKDAAMDLIVFHCTGVTTLDPGMGERLVARIEETTGIPATSTAHGLVEAFGVLDTKRVVLVTPYPDNVNETETRFLEHFGIEVLGATGLGKSTGPDMIAVEPREWYELAMANRHDDADAYFLSCTTIRAAPIIAALERDIGKPVVTSNQAMVWHCLRKRGIHDRIDGFGTLFSH
jgi:maleate isomerase